MLSIADSMLIIGDTHLREDSPRCRTDDYLAAQWRKLDFIMETAKSRKVKAILHAGDLVHICKNRTTSTFLSEIIDRLKSSIPILLKPGNHDCPNHREDKILDGRLSAILSGVPNLSIGCPEGVEMLHTFVWHPDDRPSEKIPGESADEILDRTKAQLVITGDNHQSFVFEREPRLLVNPGSMMRMTSIQAAFRPTIYHWDGSSVHAIRIPIEKGVVLEDAKEEGDEMDDRMDRFISKMEKSGRIVMDYRTNMREYLGANPTNSRVSSLIWEAIDGESY